MSATVVVVWSAQDEAPTCMQVEIGASVVGGDAPTAILAATLC